MTPETFIQQVKIYDAKDRIALKTKILQFNFDGKGYRNWKYYFKPIQPHSVREKTMIKTIVSDLKQKGFYFVHRKLANLPYLPFLILIKLFF